MSRSLQLVVVLCVAGLVPGGARTHAVTSVICKDGSTAPGGRGACRGHGGVDKSATDTATAAEPAANAGGSVTCKDGTSWPKAGRGACRGHGGVDKGAGGTPRAAAPSARAAEPEANAGPVTCKDGSSWPKAGRGACRGHGGVLKPGETATAPAAPRAAAPSTPRAAAPAPVARPSAPMAPSNPNAAVAQTKSKHASTDPSGALARCKDGMYWHGTRHSGSCSRHGGVAEWLSGPS
jgi:hypothetical protein